MRFYYDSSGARVLLKTSYATSTGETFGMFCNITMAGMSRLVLQREGIVERVREAGGEVYGDTVELTTNSEELSRAGPSATENVFNEIMELCEEAEVTLGTAGAPSSFTTVTVRQWNAPFLELVTGYSDFLKAGVASGALAKVSR